MVSIGVVRCAGPCVGDLWLASVENLWLADQEVDLRLAESVVHLWLADEGRVRLYLWSACLRHLRKLARGCLC